VIVVVLLNYINMYILVDGVLKNTSNLSAKAFNVALSFAEVTTLNDEDQEAVDYYHDIKGQGIKPYCDCGCGGDNINFDLFGKGCDIVNQK